MRFLIASSLLAFTLAEAGIQVKMEYRSPALNENRRARTSVVFDQVGESLTPLPGIDLKWVSEKENKLEFAIHRYEEVNHIKKPIGQATVITLVGQEASMQERNDKGELVFELKLHPTHLVSP